MALGLGSITLEPARLAARIELVGIPAGASSYTITRTAPSGNTAGVRGAVRAPVAGASVIVRDYEVPFDTTVMYEATAHDGASQVGLSTGIFRVNYGECEAWLVDLARPTNSLALPIESMDQLAFEVAAGVHRVLDRRAPVLTTLPAWTPSAELAVVCDTLSERDRVRALLGSGYPILLRTAPELGVGNMYLGVTGFVEERFLRPGFAPQRRFRAQVVQVERPDPALFAPAPPNTYAYVKATYASYALLRAGVGIYDRLAYTYPPDAEASPVTPWLPDDV